MIEIIRCFLPTANINKISLCTTGLEVRFYYFMHYISLKYCNAKTRVLHIEQLVVDQVITFNKNKITQKRNLVTVLTNIRPNSIISKTFNTRLRNQKVFNNNKNIVHYFEHLSIDTDNDFILISKSFHTESQQFYISICQLHSFKSLFVVSFLADNAFKHQIILRDKTVSSIISASYIFNLSTNFQYNNTWFLGLLIDLCALIQSTSDISQLKWFPQLNISIKFDKKQLG